VKSTSQDRIVIFQENALFPWLNVVQNIEFGLDKPGSERNEEETWP